MFDKRGLNYQLKFASKLIKAQSIVVFNRRRTERNISHSNIRSKTEKKI